MLWFVIIFVICLILGHLAEHGRFGAAIQKDGPFALHPSLRALWRRGYDEEGKRLDGTVVTTEMWWLGA